MHWLDVAVLGLMVWMGFRGMMNGMISGLFRLLGLILGTILAARYGALLGAWFVQSFNAPEQAGLFIGYAAVFLVVVIVAQSLAGVLRSFLDMVLLGWLDKSGGVIFGAVKALIIVFVAFYGMTYLPQNPISEGIERGSRFHAAYQAYAPGLYQKFVAPMLKGGNKSRPLRRGGSDLRTLSGPELFEEMLNRTKAFNSAEVEYLIERYRKIDFQTQQRILQELKDGNTTVIYDILTGQP